ncbi:hypothetical protein OKW21_003839 [Catalinimonas alkaloidigena]|nr:hypothetical protein [Catalinimonas alkaloidigena]MDF9798576.1 hypothetical protein [Catalinimonas alkaloidigena]
MDKLKREEGFIDVDGGKVWYEIRGVEHNTPMIMLQGGPGAPVITSNP